MNVATERCARRAKLPRLLVVAACVNLCLSAQQPADRGDENVYKGPVAGRRQFSGPDGKANNTAASFEVPIGYFGSADAKDPLAGSYWLGAKLAIDEANRAGGYQGRPFRLVTAWSADPWGSGIKQLAELAFQQRVLAVIGSVDGAAVHLAEQVSAKALFPLIDVASTDVTVNYASVPWIFSCLPGDRSQVAVIAAALRRFDALSSYALLTAIDHDTRALTAELRKDRLLQNHLPIRHSEFAGAAEGVAAVGDLPLEAKAVVVLGGPEPSARIVAALRKSRPELPIIGSAALARTSFRTLAGATAEGTIFPAPPPLNYEGTAFQKLWASNAGEGDPDYAAFYAYESVRALVRAVRQAGLDRMRLREVLEEQQPWNSGDLEIRWDASGRSPALMRSATWKDGRIAPVIP